MAIIEENNLGKRDDSKVDITKLSYTDDYKSYLGTKEAAATTRFNRLQYLRFMAIIAILESIVVDNLVQKHLMCVAVALAIIFIAIIIGNLLFKSILTSINLVSLSTLISATLYYLKHK